MLFYYLFTRCEVLLILLLVFVVSLFAYTIARIELNNGKVAHWIVCIPIVCSITLHDIKFLIWDFVFGGFSLLKVLCVIIEIPFLSYIWGTTIYKYVVKTQY